MSSPETPGSQAVDGAEISDDDEGSSAFGVTPLGIWGLAWPTMLAMGAGTVVRLTDFAMVGDLGPSATAAIGVGGNFYWLIESLASVPSIGQMAILARGRRRRSCARGRVPPTGAAAGRGSRAHRLCPRLPRDRVGDRDLRGRAGRGRTRVRLSVGRLRRQAWRSPRTGSALRA